MINYLIRSKVPIIRLLHKPSDRFFKVGIPVLNYPYLTGDVKVGETVQEMAILD
jgi:hypothetical protein